MNTKIAIAGAIIIIAVLISTTAAYIYVNSNSTVSPTPTPTPTTVPTATPTLAPTNAPTSTPTHAPTTTPTSAPTTAPTATPTVAPTATATPTSSPSPTPSPVFLSGSGATFPAPFLNSSLTAFTITKPWITVNYQGVGSGAGINALTAKTVDFAASDAPMTDSQRTAAPNVVHIPETIGAITIGYQLPGVGPGLKLTGAVIAQIFLGTITNWNDPAITALNSGVTLPNHSITTVHRSESSGTTNVFTKYLALVSPTWNSQIGAGNSVQWPNGIGAQGNNAVAATVEQTQYSIGYVELAYALQNNMTVAAVQNPAGNYISPSLASTTSAVAAGASGGLPAGDASWTSVSLLNTNAADAYPIVTFTYLLEYKELNVIPGMTMAKATAIVQMLWYVVHTGQNSAAPLSYATLPANVVTIDETTIRSITFNGQTLSVT
jgi:phosphate transport system substrate-binding protein